MIRKISSILVATILLYGLLSSHVYANHGSSIKTPDFFPHRGYVSSFTLFEPNTISTKSGEKYDEAKDPALRKGTENWEETQGSFFVVPALVIGVIVLALFFSREK
jgi:hypothetical protein